MHLALGPALLAGFIAVALALCEARLFFGVDFTDEAFYVAVAYRFALGGTPYLDELSVPQTTVAVLLAPPVALYHAVVGRGGLVLFVRELHFVLALGLGSAVTLALRRPVGGASALLVAVVAVAFVPYAIPSVSYDSAGCELFTAGSLLVWWSRSEPRVRLAAGLVLGLAGFVYPPLFPAVALCCLLSLALADGRGRSLLLRAVAPALSLPLLGFGGLTARAGPGHVLADYHRAAHYYAEAGGLSKLREIETQFRHSFVWWMPLAAALLVLLCARIRRWSRLSALLVVVLPLGLLPAHPLRYTASLAFVEDAGFLALSLLVLARGRREARELMLLVWLPALAGGMLTAYASTNGGIDFGVGFFPALIVTLVLASWALEGVNVGRLAFAPALLVAAAMLVIGVIPVYRDGPLWTLGTRVASGPYAGIATSSGKAQFLIRLETDLGPVSPACRIAFFDDFPAGYLLTSARIDANEVWTTSLPRTLTGTYDTELVRYFYRHGLPNIVVVMRRIPYSLPGVWQSEGYAPDNPLLVAVRASSYRLVARRLDYRVYRRGRC